MNYDVSSLCFQFLGVIFSRHANHKAKTALRTGLHAGNRVLNDDGAYDEPRPEHQQMFDRAWGSQDVIEAQVARIEKRPPKFTGA